MKENKTVYCAFLRGVNVKGTAMKMADAVQVFSDAGMEKVSAVLATGNIIFSSEKPRNELKQLLENALSDKFGYQAHLFIVSKDEIGGILKSAPFEIKDTHHNYIFIGTEGIADELLTEFQKTDNEDQQAEIRGGNFYWQVAKGNTLDSPFGKILGRKYFKDKTTSRNINTIEKILKKL